MIHLKTQKLLLVIKAYFWIILTVHLKNGEKMAFGGASTLNEFVRKTQLGILFFNHLFIKACHPSDLSQNKFVVIYWDLRGLYFYNT